MSDTNNEMCLSSAIDILKNSNNLNEQEKQAFEYIRIFIDKVVSIAMG